MCPTTAEEATSLGPILLPSALLVPPMLGFSGPKDAHISWMKRKEGGVELGG